MCTKRNFSILVFAILLYVSDVGSETPAASWVSIEGLSPKAELQIRHLRAARCIPDNSDIDLPIYPDASIISIDWGLVAPSCSQRDGWEELGALVMVSRANKYAVVKWYARELPQYSQYDGEVGTIFINRRIDNFLWERDYAKYSNITIMQSSNDFRDAGYSSFIELNRPKTKKDFGNAE
jgi:hypothetical protein